MRIINGKLKGRRIEVPGTFKARPTTDFAKENLFNVLANMMDFEECDSALDLFAGTGSISLELVSRGCKEVVSIEKDYKHYCFLRRVKQELELENWNPVCKDVLQVVPRIKRSFGFVFADPPYALKQIPQLPSLVMDNGLLRSGGIMVLEHGSDNRFEQHPRFLQHREYGSVNFSFFAMP